MSSRPKGIPETLEAEDLLGLVQLQRLDDTIAALDQAGLKRPGERNAAAGEVAKAEAAVAEARDLVKATQKRIDAETLQSETLKAEVKKLEGQLYSLKSNDEFGKMKAQIALRRGQESKLQDKVLELMMALDELKERIPEREHELAAARAHVSDVDRRNAVESAATDDKLAAKRAERDLVAASVPPELLQRYEAVRSRREGVGIAPVDPDGEICRGCFTQVTMQILNQIMASRFVTCPHCDRILYLSQNLPR